MKKVVDPVFESRTDYDIFAAISERLGKGKEFTEGKSEMDWIQSFYDAALTQAKAKNIPMPEFDAFWNGAGLVEFPVTSGKSFVRYAKFREDPLLEPLGTPSGKIEIYSKNIEKMGYDDCGPHPMWYEPAERLGGPTTKYKLHVAASHPSAGCTRSSAAPSCARPTRSPAASLAGSIRRTRRRAASPTAMSCACSTIAARSSPAQR